MKALILAGSCRCAKQLDVIVANGLLKRLRVSRRFRGQKAPP